MIQVTQLTFLALLLAHLLGDFPLQPNWIVRNKGKRIWPLLCHGLIHYVLAWFCLFLFHRLPFLSIYNQIALLAYALLHSFIDKLKSRLIASDRLPDNWQVFLLDQLFHVLVLAATACVLTHSPLRILLNGLNPPQDTRIHILEAAIVYIAVIFGGGYLIRYLTQGIAPKTPTKDHAHLENAGLYVGWVERLLVITAILIQSPALVGLILTGKSIARYPEFKEARFAEYFLIGTLLSIALSILGGIFLSHLLYGTVSLK
jgi:hypothetical protein